MDSRAAHRRATWRQNDGAVIEHAKPVLPAAGWTECRDARCTVHAAGRARQRANRTTMGGRYTDAAAASVRTCSATTAVRFASRMVAQTMIMLGARS